MLFAGGISTAIFFLRRNLGHGDSVLCDTAVKWMAPCYIFAFIHIINACIPKFGPNLFSESAVSPACTPKSFCFSHHREYMQPANPQRRTCQHLKISFLTLVSRANLKGKLKHSRELKEIPVS